MLGVHFMVFYFFSPYGKKGAEPHMEGYIFNIDSLIPYF